MATQENQAPDAAQEQRKKVLLGVLAAVMIFVFWWQDPFELFTSDDAGTVANAQPKTSPTPRISPTPRGGKELPVVTSELKPELAFLKNTPLDGIGRNIFVYPTPTPAPTPKPLPPPPPAPTPPINLVGINPAGVIGKTGEFNMTVTGLKFPGDARIYLDGREIQTQLIDESHLQGVVTAEMIRTPGNLGVQVRSVADAKMYSNQLSLNVAEPPAPPYRYVGLIVSKQGTIAVLKSQTDDDMINVKKGQVVGKPARWEIVSISAQRIEIMDRNIKVSHVINFTGDTGGV